jgi:hypothetical protein
MALRENIDFVLIKRASLFDGGRMNQQAGNLLATKNFLILNVVQNIDVAQAAFGDGKHEEEYRDDRTLNPIKNIANSAHNVKVSTQELKESFAESKEFYRQQRLIKENYNVILEQAVKCNSIEELEEFVRQLSLRNEKSLVLRVDQIFEFKTGFFKIWFNGIKLLMRDTQQFEIAGPGGKRIKTFIGK